MSITNSALTANTNTTAATSFATASITPTANRLVLAWVVNFRAAGSANVPTLTGNSLTWVQVATIALNGTQINLTLFRALGASPTAGAITIDFAGQTQDALHWLVSEFGGINTGGTNGSAAVVQSASNSTAGTSLAVTLAAFASPGNGCAGGFFHPKDEAVTPGSGFTKIHETIETTFFTEAMTEWRSDNATTVDASWATSVSAAAIAVEIAASVVPPDDDSWNVTIVQPQETLVSIW